jgi:hypothetical protein
MTLAGIYFAFAKLSLHTDAIFFFPRLLARARLPFHMKGKAAKGKKLLYD